MWLGMSYFYFILFYFYFYFSFLFLIFQFILLFYFLLSSFIFISIFHFSILSYFYFYFYLFYFISILFSISIFISIHFYFQFYYFHFHLFLFSIHLSKGLKSGKNISQEAPWWLYFIWLIPYDIIKLQSSKKLQWLRLWHHMGLKYSEQSNDSKFELPWCSTTYLVILTHIWLIPSHKEAWTMSNDSDCDIIQNLNIPEQSNDSEIWASLMLHNPFSHSDSYMTHY